MPLFDMLATEAGAHGVFFAAGGCPPLVVADHLIRENPQCVDNALKTLDYISKHKIKTVFLVASWDESYPHFDDNGSHSVLGAFEETLEKIPKDTEIVILQRIPRQPDFQVRELFYLSITTGVVPEVSVSKDEFLNSAYESRSAIERVA